MGLGSGKSPAEIADLIQKSTNIPLKVCNALVQAELLATMKALERQQINTNMPEGSKFKYDL